MHLGPVAVCLCLAISSSVVVAGHGPSWNLYNFIVLLSGYYENDDQQSTNHCTGGLDNHGNSSNLWKPVSIDSLHDEITFYNEVVIDGQLISRTVWVVTEDHCGVIHVQSLRAVDHESTQPGELEHADFNYVTLQERAVGCEMLFYSVDDNVFVGTIPGCFGEDAQTLPKFGITLTCYSASFHVCNIESPGRRPTLPYINFKKFSYPLTSAMTEGTHFDTHCFFPNDY